MVGPTSFKARYRKEVENTNHGTHVKRCPYFIGDMAEHVLDRRRRQTVRAWRSVRSFGLLDSFGKRPPTVMIV
jgi:hypothetical protein